MKPDYQGLNANRAPICYLHAFITNGTPWHISHLWYIHIQCYLSMSHTRGAVCFQFTHFFCDDWENIYTLSYHHHQIGSMNYYPLFRVRSRIKWYALYVFLYSYTHTHIYIYIYLYICTFLDNSIAQKHPVEAILNSKLKGHREMFEHSIRAKSRSLASMAVAIHSYI